MPLLKKIGSGSKKGLDQDGNSKEEATLIIPDGHTKALIEQVFGVKTTEDTVVLPGIMSRKKQIIPALHRSLEGGRNLAA